MLWVGGMQGSYGGDAAGFRLNSLLKLQDIRANKPRLNLMHYVAMVTNRRFQSTVFTGLNYFSFIMSLRVRGETLLLAGLNMSGVFRADPMLLYCPSFRRHVVVLLLTCINIMTRIIKINGCFKFTVC